MEPGEPSKPAVADQDAVSRLHEAVIANDENLVRELLTQYWYEDIAAASDAGGRTALHAAVEHSRLTLIPLLLENGADMEAFDGSGRTVLHHAVARNSVPLTTLLLEYGADPGHATSDGETPLWMAARQGHEPMVKLLLQWDIDVESFNPKSGTTALFEAVKQGHAGIAKLLLDNGADIDARRTGHQAAGKDGASGIQRDGAASMPPMRIIQEERIRHRAKRRRIPAKTSALHWMPAGPGTRRKPAPTSVLGWMSGEPGTRKKIRKDPGTVEYQREEVIHSRPSPQHLPDLGWTTRYDDPRPPHRPDHADSAGLIRVASPRPPPPGRFLDHGSSRIVQPEADREIPLHRAVMSGDIDMVKLLLQHGADAGIRGKDGRTAEQVAEDLGMEELATLLRSGLLLEGPEITKQDNGKRSQEAPPPPVPRALPAPRHNPAKMAACRCFEATMVEFYTEGREQRYQQSASVYEVLYGKGPKTILDAERPRSVAGKTATFTWYHLPANNMEWVEALIARLSTPHNLDPKAAERFKEKLGIHRRKPLKASPTTRPSFVRPHSKEIKDHVPGEIGVSSAEPAHSALIAFIPYLHFESHESHDSLSFLMKESASTGLPPPPPNFNSFPPRPAGPPEPPVNPYISQRETTGPEAMYPPAPPTPPDLADPGIGPDHDQFPSGRTEAARRDHPRAQTANERQPHGRPSRDGSTQSAPKELDLVHPYVHLIRGYFWQEKPGDIPGWQPRRSLDGYFYTHLADTRRRDGDQVVLRYTRDNRLPIRLFMVDQLWTWILGSDTIITCSPLNWDSWVKDDNVTQGRPRKSNNIHILAREDPMNLHQRITRHLKRGDRKPVTSVHDLASLIADTCTGLFDQDEIPDEFRFFDFFERDIARLSDTAMRRLEDFRESLERTWHPSTSDSMAIKKELSLLVEIQDIGDELEILAKVLKDQHDAMTEMKDILAARGLGDWAGSRMTELHIQWVDRMQKMANKTKESLYHLLNLKLKQASFSEAMDTRKQAEDTKQQTKLAAKHSEVMADQLTAMKNQAIETGKQGRTLLVFTVVTIIFLPSSFMAAIFSVDLDSFPATDNDKLPLDYFLQYLFAISCAITIPLLLIAFNLTRIAVWWEKAKAMLGRASAAVWVGYAGPGVALITGAAAVGAIWAAPLAVGVKTAVTVCIALIVLVAFVALAFHAAALRLRRNVSGSVTDDGSSYASSRRSMPVSVG